MDSQFRRLIDYLPPVIGETKDFMAIMEAEQPELESLREAADNLLKDQFVMDATENGVKRRETALKITPKASDSPDARKHRVLVKMNEYLPYTKRALKRMLDILCGEGAHTETLYNQIHELQVTFDYNGNADYYDVYSLLDRVTPAALILSLKVCYELPDAYVYAAGCVSGTIRRTNIDWELYYSSGAEANICTAASTSGAVRSTAFDTGLFFSGPAKAEVGISADITGVYRLTMLNE